MPQTAQAITPRGLPLPDIGDPLGDSAAFARKMLRAMRSAALATLDPGSGYPFASAVNVATDMDGAPLLLISRTALHTRNLLADARMSLMPLPDRPAPASGIAPMSGPRLTVAGLARQIDDKRALRRYLACHPKMKAPSTFNFNLWRLEPEVADILSFGDSLKPADILVDLTAADELREREAELVAELNAAHIEALRGLDGLEGGSWQVVCLDPEGIDLRLGRQAARLVHRRRVSSRGELLAALGELQVEAAPA